MRILAYIFLISICLTSCRNAPSEKPNIILIMTDDQGWGDVGFNGNTEIKTPHIDQLASEGIKLNRFYSASAVCSPTRASVITGRNPLRMDIPYANAGFMKVGEITLPEVLKQEGYATAHFGKWHLGTFTTTELDANRGGRPKHQNAYSIPTQHGYDEFFCTESKVPTYDPLLIPAELKNDESHRYGWRAREDDEAMKPFETYYWKAENVKATENIDGDNSQVIMDRVVPFIEKSKSNNTPFFTTIWLHTPHLPVVSDRVHREMYKGLSLEKQLYYGSITAMDEQIGRLWTSLEEQGIADNTLIFFCSDNGPERGTPGSAGPFRERKRSLYEGGVRVPAFVIWKNELDGGRTVDFPMVTSDYLPTILDILNIEQADARPIDGISILNALKGTEVERAKPIGFICRPFISWTTQQYKLIGDESLEEFELYDLLNDPSEEQNIIADYPEIAQKMEVDLRVWLESVEKSKAGMDY